jgi:hypothetical protein
MNMIDYVSNALNNLNIPVLWNIRPSTYPSITYFFYDSSGQVFGDGEELGTAHYLQVDVWAKNKITYTSTIDKVKTNLKAVGFVRQGEADLFEKEINTYHKAIRFQYLENTEN